MAEIQVFNGNKRMAITSKAYNCKITHELMRMYTLTFEVVNTDGIRKYINETAQFIADGQAFDVTGYNKKSGSDNTTSVSAQHVGYRMNNYILPPYYAFVGTLQDIAQDILNNSKNEDDIPASSEFTIGNCPNLGTLSFNLNNDSEVTARYAIMALKNIGAESDYDNFTINFADKISSGNSEVFEFGVNMANVGITYSKGNGTTYDVDIVDLQEIPGHVGNVFSVGDTITVKDALTGESFSKRIITYTKCLDDTTKNSITLGVFISDVSTETIQMKVEAEQMQADLNKTVREGESYNGVDITHEYGFKSTSADGQFRLFNNGTDGYVVQRKYNGNWITTWQTETSTGTTKSYNLTHTLKIEQGGNVGLALYSGDGGGNWTLLQQLSAEGLGSTKLFGLNDPNTNLKIGTFTESQAPGMGLYINDDVYDISELAMSFTGGRIRSYRPLTISGNGNAYILLEGNMVFLGTIDESGNNTRIKCTPTKISIEKNGNEVAGW